MNHENTALEAMAAEAVRDTEIALIQERLGCDWKEAWNLAKDAWERDIDGHLPSHSGARNS